MKQIQLFVPTFRTEECLEEIRECLEKGSFPLQSVYGKKMYFIFHKKTSHY